MIAASEGDSNNNSPPRPAPPRNYNRDYPNPEVFSAVTCSNTHTNM